MYAEKENNKDDFKNYYLMMNDQIDDDGIYDYSIL